MGFPSASQADLDRVATTLGQGKEKRSASGWMTLCPVPEHGDTKPSLKVDLKDGELLFHCKAGCAQVAVFNAIKDMGLLPGGRPGKALKLVSQGGPIDWNKQNEPAGNVADAPGYIKRCTAKLTLPKNFSTPPHIKPTRASDEVRGEMCPLTAVYPYYTASGAIVGYVARYDGTTPGDKAAIPYFVPERGGYAPGVGEYSKGGLPLYGLPRVVTADTILICEGEKAAEALLWDLEWSEARKYEVTTWRGGTSAWKQTDWTPLKGKHVILWPDNDAPGHKAMKEIGAHLQSAARSIKWVKWAWEAGELGDEKIDAYDLLDHLGETSLLAWLESHLVSWEPVTREEKLEVEERDEDDGAGADRINAELFAQVAAKDYKYTAEGGWFKWISGSWGKQENVLTAASLVADEWSRRARASRDEEETKRCRRQAKRCSSVGPIQNFLNIAKELPQIKRKPEDFDINPWQINMLNGLFDVREDKFIPHDSDSRPLATKVMPCEYDEEAECPIFEEFLRQILVIEGNSTASEEYVRFVQTALGYSMTGYTKEQKFFLCYGSGSNGKTTLLELIRRMLGDYARTSSNSLLLKGPTYGAGNPDYMAAYLQGARFILPGEIDKDAKFDAAKVKDITGGAAISARNLGRPYFEFVPVCKLWLCGNYRPDASSEDDGLWRRLICLPFTQQIPEEKQNKELGDQLWEERSGILNWLLEGARLYEQHRLRVPSFLSDEAKEYRDEVDVTAKFLVDSCEYGKHYEIQSSALHKAYVDWAEREGERPISNRKLTQDLKRRGYAVSRNEKTRLIQGLRLRLDLPNDDENVPF